MGGESDLLPWGVGCLIAAALSYLTARDCRLYAHSLARVIRINHIKDFSLLFDAASLVLPLIVTVSGKVGSDRPIQFYESGNVQPVILHKTTKTCILKRKVKTEFDSNGDSKEVVSWIEEHGDSHTVKNEVPWYLEDGTGQVFVSKPQHDLNFRVPPVRRVYSSKILPVKGTRDSNQNAMDLVVKTTVTTNPVLLTGTPLQVIGEAVKDDLGRIRIQKPKKGPFYVSQKNIDQLSDDKEIEAWWCTHASILFASFGICLIGTHIFQYIKGRYWQNRCRVIAAVTEIPGTDDKAEAGDGLDVTELISDLCVICLEQEYNSAFVPCGHMCCCEDCSSSLTECPLCRELINQVVRIFRG